MGWIVRDHCIQTEQFPHENAMLELPVEWKQYPGAWMARWTTNFDCKEKTLFWYCIKDEPFDISKLKAKRRYEITKGNRNFYTKVIEPHEYSRELYDVYCESLTGYDDGRQPCAYEEYIKFVNAWENVKELVLFGVFSKETHELCGYADIYNRSPYLPISSIKTRPKMERGGVNAALIYGILEYFKDSLNNGCYLCDGARVTVHKTNFQEYLEKYFNFRKAYSDLHVEFKQPLAIMVKLIFPIRSLFESSHSIVGEKIKVIMTLEAWKRGFDK